MSQKSSLRYQAQMADINARIAEGNARNIIQAGTVEESRVKLAGALAKGSQRAQLASSGVDIAGSNTALARLTTTDVITEVDANTMRSNALRAAWGQRFQATDEINKANSLRASASSISPVLAGLGTALTEGGKVASSWYTANKQGAFDKQGSTSPSLSTYGADSSVWGNLGIQDTINTNRATLSQPRGGLLLTGRGY